MPLESVSKWIREPRAWRAEAYLGSTLSTASKSNEVDAALARLAADVVSEKRARPLLEEVGARCPLDLWGSHPGALPRRTQGAPSVAANPSARPPPPPHFSRDSRGAGTASACGSRHWYPLVLHACSCPGQTALNGLCVSLLQRKQMCLTAPRVESIMASHVCSLREVAMCQESES